MRPALDACADIGDAVVTADLWDIERLPACEACGPQRAARLARLNLSGVPEPRIGCDACGGSAA
jgi:hypothetical protein